MNVLNKISRVPRRDRLMMLASRIEDLDEEMQVSIEVGDLEKARRLAEEQEQLLERLMLLQRRF